MNKVRDGPAKDPEPPEGDPDSSLDQRDPSRWWKRIRVLLQLAEAVAVCKQHEALAAGARALVIIGDATRDYVHRN